MARFWKLVESLSEPGGSFSGENYVSNEPQYGDVLTQVEKTLQPGGVYIGVGPEQNFNHIAALRPRMAFVLDIRRQNAIELLMYRALFELSPDRATFLSRLFSRRRPAGVLKFIRQTIDGCVLPLPKISRHSMPVLRT